MKAISLQQPWATLVAIEAKKIETRSWAAKYRGALAIHTSKDMRHMLFWKELPHQEPFRAALKKKGYFRQDAYLTTIAKGRIQGRHTNNPYNLPYGAVILTCNLVDCVKVEQTDGMMAWLEHGYIADNYEYLFGDYTPGRYAWILEDVNPLPEPVPARGKLGLWEWEPEEA